MYLISLQQHLFFQIYSLYCVLSLIDLRKCESNHSEKNHPEEQLTLKTFKPENEKRNLRYEMKL